MKVAVLSTFTNRSSDLADIPIVFKPGTDLAILNYIANHIISTGRVNQDFVKKHTTFVKGATDIGYGLRPDDPLEVKAKRRGRRRRDAADRFRRLCRLREGLHAREGLRADRRRAAASCRSSPSSMPIRSARSMSLWTMGFNQHVRGVWANQLVYNLHLLTGKISEPGNSPVLADRPALGLRHGARGRHLRASPAGRHGGDQSGASQACRGNLARPARHHSGEAGLSRRRAGPDAEGRQAEFLLDPGQQQPAGRAEQLATRPIRAIAIRTNFIVVSDAYPTVTAMAADLILPAAMWVEKEGAYGNAERRTHFWHQLVNAPGEARSDLWQLMEFSKRFTTDEVWPAEILDANPELSRQDAVRRAVPQRQCRQVRGERDPGRIRQPRSPRHFGFYVQKGLFEEYATFGRGHGHDLAPFDTLSRDPRPALAGRRRQGNALALSRRARSLREAGQGRRVLRQHGRQGADHRGALRAAGGIARQGISTSGWSPAACWNTGIPAR